jgi:signal transduction histidine kinase
VRRHADWLLAGGVGVLAQVEIWTSEGLERRGAHALLALAAASALGFRRRAPLAVLGVLAAVFAAGAAFLEPPSGDDPLGPAIALLIAVYSAGAYATGVGVAAGAAVAVALPALAVLSDPEPVGIDDYLFFLVLFGGPWLAGRAIQLRRRRERDLILGREHEARAAVLEERSRIARELHDVVAHAISVIVLQARGARHSLDAEPREARGRR